MPRAKLPSAPPSVWTLRLLATSNDVVKLLDIIADTGIGLVELAPVRKVPAKGVQLVDGTVENKLLLTGDKKLDRKPSPKFEITGVEFAAELLKQRPMTSRELQDEFVRAGRSRTAVYQSIHSLKAEKRIIKTFRGVGEDAVFTLKPEKAAA